MRFNGGGNMNGKPIILLDLNVTLVINNNVHEMPYYYRPHLEEYRTWLVGICRTHHTILITSRPEKYKKDTLLNLHKRENWQPNEALFNQWPIAAPEAKKRFMETHVIPTHGTPQNQRYIAIESNTKTRAMYKTLNVEAYTQQHIQENPHILKQTEGTLF
jgi:hypothetical protein